MMMPTTINPDMGNLDHTLISTQQQSMVDVCSYYKFSALKAPHEYSWGEVLNSALSDEVQALGFRAICRDANQSLWFIVTFNENISQYIALGQFTFGEHFMELNSVDVVTIIRLDENRLVQTKVSGTVCCDSFINGGFWVLCQKPIDSNQAPSLDVPATIPVGPQVPEMEGEFHQASQLPAETHLHGSGDVVSSEFERLPPPVDFNELENDDDALVGHPCGCIGDSFCENCFVLMQTHDQVTPIDSTTNMPAMEPQELHSMIIAPGQSSSPNFTPTHEHGLEAPGIMDTGLVIEDLPLSIFDYPLETVQPALQQGSEEFFHVEETINAPCGHDGEMMECQVPNASVATTSTNPRKRKAPQPKRDKHHGVIKRQGGRQSFVAYFRPKDLPESDKKFVTVGEFKNENDAWHAFNLFAMVHEGIESCMNVTDEDIESLEYDVDIGEWKELPRVDLLAFLRRKGRSFFKDPDLEDVEIPKYRNIKFTMNKRGKHKGKIRWFCDVGLNKEMVDDPKVVDITTSTCTFDTAEEAARKADKLMILKEGIMAWTNFTITDYLDYLTDVDKEKLRDNLWIPMDDNPRKYLSTNRY